MAYTLRTGPFVPNLGNFDTLAELVAGHPASTYNPGTTAYTVDQGQVIVDSGQWQQLGSGTILAQSGVPMIQQSSGTMGANGALTGLTALGTTYASCYLYFPTGKAFSASPAGFYYAVMSSTTAGTVYNNPYVSGSSLIPSTLVPIVDAGPGAYTQTTGAITAITIPLLGGAMGNNGKLIIEWMQVANNTAGNKFVVWQLGASGNLISTLLTTGLAIGAYTRMTNKGVQNSQTSGAGASGSIGSQGAAPFRTTIDTSTTQNILILSNIAVATDNNAIEDFSVTLYPN